MGLGALEEGLRNPGGLAGLQLGRGPTSMKRLSISGLVPVVLRSNANITTV